MYSPVSALAHAHAAGMCGHDSNPLINDNHRRPKGAAMIVAPTRGFEPPTPRLGGECSILLSYVDMPIFWLKHWVFRQSAVAAVFMISDGFRRPEISDENFWFQVGGRLLQNDSHET